MAVVAAVAMLGGVAGVSATAMADDGNASTTQSQTTDEKAAASAPAPLSTEGTEGVPDDPTLSAPAREKTVTANGDGTYKVALNVTGAKSTDTGEIVTNQPLDIVLVLDVSGSMDGPLSGGTKIDALKTAVNGFIDATADENATITDRSQRNRIALVKFAGDVSSSVGDDFYREGWSSYNYTQIVSNLTDEVSGLTDTVDGLRAAGATSADYAFDRAEEALDQARSDAKKVVIFFTDGEPNHGSGFDPIVAATAVNKAKSLKDAGTTIYSIGVVSGANPGDTSSNLNKYMHGISSNYPNATATSWTRRGTKYWSADLGDRAESSSYYKAATDAGQLNNIFESIYQEITKMAEYAGVTIHDRLSSWVVSSDSASENGEPAGFTYTKTRNGQITAWADAPEATVAADGTVSWPVMSNGGKLEDGVTYTVSFNVKPTQAAFDEAVKNHKDDANASGDNNFYTNDNSRATVDYKTVVTSSQGGTTTSDPQTAAYLQKPTITLPVSKITVTKTWSDGNENHANDSVQVQLKQDGEDYANGSATLNAAGNWTHEFTVPAGPEGHKYTVEETAVDGYDASYELAVIKDTTTSSVVAENDVKKLNLIGLTEQDGTVTITNKPSYVTLPASNLQVTKEVLGRGASADFTFNLKCEDNGDAKCENVEGLTSNGLTATVKQNQLTTSGKTATANFGDSALKFRVPTGNATQLVYKFNVTEDRTNVPAGWRYDGSTKTVTVTIAKNDDGQWAATVNDNNPTFTNKYVAVSSLPLTGGTTGRDWMVFGGGVGLMALLAAAGYTVWRKRQLV
ncbi:MAG: VWA domain-containing protein [Bifidobacterium sp.]